MKYPKPATTLAITNSNTVLKPMIGPLPNNTSCVRVRPRIRKMSDEMALIVPEISLKNDSLNFGFSLFETMLLIVPYKLAESAFLIELNSIGLTIFL